MDKLIETARQTVMSAAEREAQKRSFAYGTTHIENEDVTRGMIDAAADAGLDEAYDEDWSHRLDG